MNYQPLAWDSAFFGRAIGTVVGDAVAAADEADADGVDCLYCLIDGADRDALWAAQSAGYRVVDGRLLMERRLGDVSSVDGDIRTATAADAPALTAVAREAFVDSRFFFDPHFPPERCRELYVAWLQRGLEGHGRTTLVTDDLAGFVVCSAEGDIELIAVAGARSGRGIGSRLVRAALRTFTVAGLERARVVTQSRNVAAQRLYIAHGYRPTDLGVWLHRWREGATDTV